LQGNPGPGRDLGCLGVDRSHFGQARQAQDDLTVQRDAAADKPGVAPLRDDGHPGAGARCQDGCHLAGVAGPHHGSRLALEAARPVHGEPGRLSAGQDVPLADDRGQRPEEREGKFFHGV
jgi:hypothetical protein